MYRGIMLLFSTSPYMCVFVEGEHFWILHRCVWPVVLRFKASLNSVSSIRKAGETRENNIPDVLGQHLLIWSLRMSRKHDITECKQWCSWSPVYNSALCLVNVTDSSLACVYYSQITVNRLFSSSEKPGWACQQVNPTNRVIFVGKTQMNLSVYLRKLLLS